VGHIFKMQLEALEKQTLAAAVACVVVQIQAAVALEA
jgi:hypothetical protein